MLEFHPSLGLASRVYESLQNALKVWILMFLSTNGLKMVYRRFKSKGLCCRDREGKVRYGTTTLGTARVRFATETLETAKVK